MYFWTNALQSLKISCNINRYAPGDIIICAYAFGVIVAECTYIYIYIIIWINWCHFRWQYPVQPSDSLINISWKRVVVVFVAAMVNNNRPLATATVASVVGPDRRLPEKRALKVCIRTSAPTVLLSDRVISRHYNNIYTHIYIYIRTFWNILKRLQTRPTPRAVVPSTYYDRRRAAEVI